MAADVPASGGNDALLTAIGAVVVAAIGGGVTIFGILWSGRNRAAASAPVTAVDPSWRDFVSGELAVLKRRADDNDERDDIQDHRIELIERAKDRDHPGWRVAD